MADWERKIGKGSADLSKEDRLRLIEPVKNLGALASNPEGELKSSSPDAINGEEDN